MKIKTGLFLLFILLLNAIGQQSCLPYKSYERNKLSNCIFLDLKKTQIEKMCNDGQFDKIISLEVTVKYDSIKLIDNRPSDSYTLYKVNKEIHFPYRLEPSVVENRDKDMIISMKTNVRDQTFALRLNKSDWENEKLTFTYYYNK